jgi:hypothetical protein
LAKLRKKLEELIGIGFIHPSKTPYDTLVLFQKKANRSFKMSFNYQTLNKVTIKNKFKVHLIQELMDRMKEVSILQN